MIDCKGADCHPQLHDSRESLARVITKKDERDPVIRGYRGAGHFTGPGTGCKTQALDNRDLNLTTTKAFNSCILGCIATESGKKISTCQANCVEALVPGRVNMTIPNVSYFPLFTPTPVKQSTPAAASGTDINNKKTFICNTPNPGHCIPVTAAETEENSTTITITLRQENSGRSQVIAIPHWLLVTLSLTAGSLAATTFVLL
ncbi:MAG: hypothetical protein M1827_000801 [Pycnora praestabilis]|nr:MAG: hypothetical protein M1827_000801 [Pycnora praestabilis]